MSAATFTVKPATRQGIIPLIGLWGGTGGGKTKTALLLARGLAGAEGRVAVVDTEHRRAEYYADSIPGGFQHIAFDEPYSPERYLEALELLESSADVGVLDSGTHLWEGPDGILDLHEQALDRMCGNKAGDWKERDRLNWPAWREPKSRYKFVRDKILRFEIPLIVCLRGEQKTRLVKEDGRSMVVTDQDTTPVFDKKFIFEMHIALECVQKNGEGGFIKFTRPFAKVSHEGIRKILPDQEKEQLGVKHGIALAAWCAGKDAAPMPPANPKGELYLLKRTLWMTCESIHGGNKQDFQQWLWDEDIMPLEKTAEELTASELPSIIERARKKLNL